VNVVGGMAALEDFLGEFVPCKGIIHVPRGMVPVLGVAGQLANESSETQLKSHLGTLFAAGGGYDNTGPDGEPAPDGEAWLYATGQTRVWLGDVFDTPPDSEAYSRYNLRNNDLLAVAERVVIVGYECDVAAIRVNINFGGC
jgi:hypothetical protein